MRDRQARNSAIVLALVSVLVSCEPGRSPGEAGASAVAPLQPAGGVGPGGDAVACTGTPPSPTNVAAVASAPNVVTLTWDDDGTPAYVVYRSTISGGPYAAVGSTAAGVVTFDDTTVSGGSTYHYVIRGLDCDESPDSNEATVTAAGDCTLPPVFAGLDAVSNTQQSTCALDLSWTNATPSCGGSIAYDVYRSRVPGFTPGLANRIATGVAGTVFTDAVNLATGTTYYYVVRAVEAGARVVGEENAVERSSAPTGLITPLFAYFDDFDASRPASAAAYWITSGTNLLSLVSGCRWQSANTAFKFGALGVCGGTYSNSATSWLVLGGNGAVDPVINGFALPAGGIATLSFHHWFNFENRYDGATLYYSTTSASGPWTIVDDVASAVAPYISVGRYPRALTTGEKAWTNVDVSQNGALGQVVVNLDALAGQTAWFGIRFRTDSSVVREGYYLDDVRLESFDVAACDTATAPPGPTASFAIGLAPSAVAGTSMSFTATAVDAWEQVVTDHAGAANVTSSDPRALASSPLTFAAGVASGDVTFGTAGVQTITAADAGDPDVQGAASTLVAPGAPAALTIAAQPTETVAGVSISPAVAVAIADAFGNLVTTATDPVTLEIGDNPGGGTLGGSTTVNASGGIAAFGDLSIARAGAGYTLVATSGALAAATSDPFDVLPDVPVALAVVTQPTTAQAGVAIAPAVEVGFVDQYGNLSPSSASVTLQLQDNPGSSWLAGTVTVPAVGGVASFPDLWLNRVGTGYTLLAWSPSFGTVVSDPFDVLPGAPYAVEVLTHPTGTTAGAPFSPPVTGAVFDRWGNLATQYVGPVQATLLGGAGAGLLGTATVTASAGVATFADLAVDKAGTGYALGLSAPGLLMGTSTAFDVGAGPATHYALVGAPASVTVGIEVTFQVRALDATGNVARDYAGTATVTSSDPAVTAPASVTFAAGEAAVPVTFRSAGLHTLTLTDAGDPTFTVTADVVVSAFPLPTAQITSPPDGEALSGVVTVTADGTVASGTTLARIAIRVDGVELASGTALPFAASWDTAGLAGPHVLTAVISDAAGNVVQSSPVVVTVAAPPSGGGCGCGTGAGADVSLLFGLAGLLLRRRRSA